MPDQDDTIALKQCTKCKEWKSATSECFHRSNRDADGLKPTCKACRNAENMAYSRRIGHEPRGRVYPDGTKRCPECDLYKPATNDYFPCNINGRNGLRSICKECDTRKGRHYYQEHRDAVLDRTKQYAKNNAERMKPYYQDWYIQNRARVLEQTHKRYRANPEKVKARNQSWRKANPARLRLYTHRYHDRKRSTLNTLTLYEWQRCLDWFGHRCAVCGRTGDHLIMLSADHWKAVSRGGSTTVDNIIPLCHAKKGGTGCCNRSKSSNDALDWLTRKYGPVEARRILAKIENYFDWVLQQP